MIIVSNTTPIHYLIQIGEIDVLQKLFGQIIIPQAVFSEMQREGTPRGVKEWITARPPWLEVRSAHQLLFTPQKKLGDGEREAIALALELSAAALLMDDRDGLKEARRNNVTVITTLNILEAGSQRGLLDLPTALDILAKGTNFRLPPAAVIKEMLLRDAERRLRAQDGLE